MLKQIRPRLTYANVVATLALFLVVAGGGALAATKLKRNSVKSKHIAPEAVTGADAAEATFGKVPSAGTADTAGTANSASSAGLANAVTPGSIVPGSLASSVRAKRLDYEAGESALGLATSLATVGELEILASCTTSGFQGAGITHVHLHLRPTVAGSVESGGVLDPGSGPANEFLSESSLPANTTTDALGSGANDSGETSHIQGSVFYRSAGSTVLMELFGSADDASGDCALHGVAVPGT